MNLGNEEGSFMHSSLVIQKRGQVCSEAEEVECLRVSFMSPQPNVMIKLYSLG